MCAYKIPISSPLLFDSLTETKQMLITGYNDDQAPCTVVEKTNGTRYSKESENQLLLCENLGLKNGLYLI